MYYSELINMYYQYFHSRVKAQLNVRATNVLWKEIRGIEDKLVPTEERGGTAKSHAP